MNFRKTEYVDVGHGWDEAMRNTEMLIGVCAMLSKAVSDVVGKEIDIRPMNILSREENPMGNRVFFIVLDTKMSSLKPDLASA